MRIPFDLSPLSLVDLFRLGSFIMGFDDKEARAAVCPTAILRNVNTPAAAILGRAVADEVLARGRGASIGTKAVKLLKVHPDADPKVWELYHASIWYWFKSWRKATTAAELPELAAVLRAGEDTFAGILTAKYETERQLKELVFGGKI